MKKIYFILLVSLCSCTNTNELIFKKKYNGYRVIESYGSNLLTQDTLTGACRNLKDVSAYYMKKYGAVGSIINEKN